MARPASDDKLWGNLKLMVGGGGAAKRVHFALVSIWFGRPVLAAAPLMRVDYGPNFFNRLRTMYIGVYDSAVTCEICCEN